MINFSWKHMHKNIPKNYVSNSRLYDLKLNKCIRVLRYFKIFFIIFIFDFKLFVKNKEKLMILIRSRNFKIFLNISLTM